jgi:hypothetical protein
MPAGVAEAEDPTVRSAKMITREDLESYLIRLDVETHEVDDGMWLLKPENGADVVCSYSPPVVLFRLKVIDLPTDIEEIRLVPLYRRLLELNAADIVHGSYGLEEGEIVLSDALELENLDFSELRSSFESLVLAASGHLPELAGLVPVTQER